MSGDTTQAVNTYSSPFCGGYGGSLFYALTLAAEAQVTAVLTQPVDGGLHAIIDLVQGCPPSDGGFGNEIACQAGDSTGSGDTFNVPRVPAGQYYLVVEGFLETQGPFSLTVTLSTPVAVPENATCASPAALTEGVSVAGDTTTSENNFQIDGQGSCIQGGFGGGDGYGNELWYSYTPTSTGSHLITVTPTTSNLDAVVAVFSACPAEPIETCIAYADNFANGAPTTLGTNLTSGTTYLILVDSSAPNAEGPFTIEVTPPLPNLTCATGLAVNPDGGSPLAIRGDTTLATKTYTSPTCSGNGPDLYYQLVVPEASHLIATLGPPDGGLFQGMVALFSSCASADGGPVEVSCSAANIGDSSTTLEVASVPAGTYGIVVGGVDGAEGPFELNVTLTSAVPPPPNNLCSAATPLAFDGGSQASASESTFGATDKARSSVCGGQGFPDVFYSLVVPTASRVTATFNQPASGVVAPVLALDPSCPADPSITEVACVASQVVGGSTVLDIPNVAAGSYIVTVDSNSGAGLFDLDVELRAPVTTAPANNTCAGAQVINLVANADGGEQGSAPLDTFAAVNNTHADSSGQCSEAGNPNFGQPGYTSASDVVFEVAVPANAPGVTARYILTDGGPDQLGSAVLLLRDGPCSTASTPETACGFGNAFTSTIPDGGENLFIWVVQQAGVPAPTGTLQVSIP